MDWADPASKPVNAYGSKARIGRAPKSSYSEWRRTVGDGCYANDVDWVEWRAGDGEPLPVAIIETTFYKDKPELRPCLPTYCQSVLARFKRDAQYAIARLVANRLGVPAYLVIARYDLAVFFVCRLRDETWREFTQDEYRRWLRWLGHHQGDQT